MAVSPQTQTQTIWTLDPAHTLVEFSAKHMMVTNVKGHFTGVTGTITGDQSDPTSAQIDVRIDPATISTGADQRDAHLRSADFFDVETYPAITFRSTDIEPSGDGEFRIAGDLTIHGVTRQVVLDAELNGFGVTPYGQSIVGATATTKINRRDFGLNWNVALEAGGVLVGDTIKISLEVEAIKQG